MKEPDDISRHWSNDDPRHFRFERYSKLPMGYFGGPRGRMVEAADTVAEWIIVAMCVGIIAAFALGWL